MAQDDLVRLHSLDFQATKTIVSEQVNAELDQLISTSNNKASRVINETIQSSWAFQKGINVASSSPTSSAGSFWYDPLANNFKAIVGSSTYTFTDVNSFIDVNTYGTDATAFVNALTANTDKIILVPNGTYNLAPTLAQVPTLLGGISRLLALGVVNITLPVGNVALSSVIPIANAYPSNIGITGATPIALSGVTWQATSGSTKNYSIVLNVPSTTGLAVGQLARVTPTAGTGSYLTLQGAWLITNVDTVNSRITIRHTLTAGSFPAFTLANATISVNTSTLTFAGSSGFLFSVDAPLKAFYQISIVGDYNLASATGTSNTYGIYSTDTANLTLGTAGQADCRINIQGFGEHGLYMKGTSAGTIGGVHSTGNRQSGVYSEGATLTGSNIVSAGNGLDATVLTQGGVDALASRATTLEGRATVLETISKDAIQGTTPLWASGTTLTMGTLNCLDSLRTTLITCASTTLNFGTTGLNGLDAGSIASNTWYYIYAILNPTTLATGFLASTSASSPTLPSGFTKFRLLPFVVKTNSGSATLQSFTMYHSDGLLRCEWLASRADEVLITQSMGSATPYVVDASSSVPPICNGLNAKLFARIYQDTGGSGSWSRLSIDPSTAGNWVSFATSPWVAERLADIPLYPTTRQFRIRNDAGGGGAAACTGIVYSQGYVFNYKGTV